MDMLAYACCLSNSRFVPDTFDTAGRCSTRAEFYKLTYTTAHVAALLDISRRAVTRLTKHGFHVPKAVGGRKMFSARAIEQYLKRREATKLRANTRRTTAACLSGEVPVNLDSAEDAFHDTFTRVV